MVKIPSKKMYGVCNCPEQMFALLYLQESCIWRRAFELKYDINNQKFAMSTINEAMGLRGEVQNRPSFIGDPTEGDAFIVLSNY